MKPKRQRGVAAVEFAPALPVLLFVIFAIVQVGWWMGNYLVLTNAASAGARPLASERGFPTPYTDTTTAILSATTSLAHAPAVTVLVVGSSRTTGCAGTTGAATRAAALGTIAQPPAAGTTADVTLTYTFAPPFGGSLYKLASIMPSPLSSNAAVVVQ
jgi:Flp pilus assembly protein TadG